MEEQNSEQTVTEEAVQTQDQNPPSVKEDALQYVKGVIEALLFISEKPVLLEQIKKVLQTVSAAEIKKAVQSLQEEYESRKSGIKIVEIAEGFQMLSNPAYVNYIREFFKTKHKEKLSKPALETLAIVAYKQPVTRPDIELIRGVNSDGVVTHLLMKELVKIVGKKDIPGKPYLYGTTRQFLEYFGLRSLENLPKLEEFEKLQQAIDQPSSGDGLVDVPAESQPQETSESNEGASTAESTQPTTENI